MPNKSVDVSLAVEVSPLWELQYTGISNVVHEICKRLLRENGIKITYTVMGRRIPKTLIETCVSEKSGAALQAAFSTHSLPALEVEENGYVDGKPTVGLFTNTKPPHKVFSIDTQIYYDFSPLLTPECHTADTVKHHMAGITEQIRTCERLFCISESTAKDLEWIFDVPRSKIRVSLLGNNVDFDFSRTARRAIGKREVEPFFLILGTIEPRKNISIVLKWLHQHPEVASSYRFVFAGREGWGPSFLELARIEQVQHLFDQQRIIHLGYVDEWSKATLLVGAHALIFPSVFEGFGLPILESMAVGTLVMSSCATSLPEVLGDCGYYFDPQSPESLHRAFLALSGDVEIGYAGQMRKKAVDRAATFSYDQTYETIMVSLREQFNSLESFAT